jgi:TonB family protein
MNEHDGSQIAAASETRRRFLHVVALLPVVLAFVPFPAVLRAEDNKDCPKGEVRTEGKCLKGPEIIKKTQAVYPKAALRKRVKASVVVSARVSTDGRADEIRVVSSSATDNAFLKDFESAALEAVKEWQYRPGTVNGEPRAMYFEATVDFDADRQKPWFNKWLDWLT